MTTMVDKPPQNDANDEYSRHAFVVSTPEGYRAYLQVTEDLADPATFERELAPLRAHKNSLPKIVLCATGLREGVTSDGIQILSLVPWLLGHQDWH